MKTFLAIVAATLFASFPQQAPTKPLYIVTYVDVFPAYAMEAANLLQTFANDSRKDPGSVRFEVLRDVARVNHFSIVEIWNSQKSYDAHLALEHTRTLSLEVASRARQPL